MVRAHLYALAFAILLLAPALPAQPLPEATDSTPTGRLVRFNATRYNDTLFAGLEPTYRATFDEDGDVWYATQGGVVQLDIDAKTRRLYTRMDGLPSSYVLSVAPAHGKVYVATDLGFAIIDRATRTVTDAFQPWSSAIPDALIREVVVDGEDVWLGTHFQGVVVYNSTTHRFVREFNTSTFPNVYAKPVRRILPTPDAIWVGTDGNGVWRLDRATNVWTNFNRSDDKLVSDTILGLAVLGGDVWLGTEKGLQRRNLTTGEQRLYNKSDGMPDERVFDVDIIPTVAGEMNVFAGTRLGLWQLDPKTGASTTLAQSYGILGDVVADNVWDEAKGWVFATNRGVSLLRAGGWQYFTTGASSGASAGPLTFNYWSAASRAPFLWFGSATGVSAFLPARGAERGVWYNFGEFQRYPGGLVNAIDIEGNTTWLGTTAGAFGYNVETNEWIDMTVTNSANLIYGLDADGAEVWIGLFGDGVIMRNLTTGVQRSWTATTLPEPIPDPAVTDLRIHGQDVWIASSIGVTRMDRLAGTFTATYTSADGLPGLPGFAAVFRVLPDAGAVWLGMKEGGVARLDVAQGKVTRVWNDTNVEGFPTGENAQVRALHREGGRLWAGTKGGLLRIDIASGAAKVFNQTNSQLVQEYVNGIASQDGILYLATASGIARMDIASERFLPMQDGADSQVIGAGTGPSTSPVSVRIDSPRDGTGVTGVVEVRGAASRFGGRIDRVEVRIGDGEWTTAEGGEFWSYSWDSGTAPADTPILVSARAHSGNDTSRIAEVLVTPVALPTIPLTIDHTPVTDATALRPLLLGARATGDEPLGVRLLYRVPGGDVYKRIDMQRQGPVFTGTIPAGDVREGILHYYLDARSGLLSATSPQDPGSPYRVTVGPAPRLAVLVEGPQSLRARAGEETTITLNVTNSGTQAASFLLSASGLRATWLSVPQEPVSLGPGETRAVTATLNVPAQAFADNTTLTFEARDAEGQADPSRTSVPVEVLAAETPPPTTTPPDKPAPAPGAALALVLALALALVTRRWRS